ncbi:hypothetical protein [Rhizobium sp. 2TAF27]|uniref:hypothetical protein n=1 Tax=Rhizobium sp. 2TAF27 TaxID=3233013 RepID=UPI003F9A90D2
MGRGFDYVGFDFSQMKNLKSLDPDEEEFRQNLLEAVRDGAITPELAEERAFDRGLNSLTSGEWNGPDIFEFRAWSIEMALAWIIWRSKRAVRHFYTPYRLKCFEWKVASRPGAQFGYALERLTAATLAAVRAKASHSKVVISYDDALKALWAQLEEGHAVGSARTLRSDDYKAIGSDEWATLRVGAEENDEDSLVSVFNEAVVRYHSVTFHPTEILRIWEVQGDHAPVAQIGADDVDPNPAPIEAAAQLEAADVDPHPDDVAAVEQLGAVDGDPNPERGEAVAQRRPPRGRKSKWAWDTTIREEAFRLLDENGNIDPDVDPNWTQARVVEAMLDFCEARWEAAPAESSMRSWVRRYLDEFRQRRAGAAN